VYKPHSFSLYLAKKHRELLSILFSSSGTDVAAEVAEGAEGPEGADGAGADELNESDLFSDGDRTKTSDSHQVTEGKHTNMLFDYFFLR